MVSKFAFLSVIKVESQNNGGMKHDDDAVIRNALLTAVNRITLMDEKSGEFEAGDGNQNMVTFEVSE